LSPLAGDADQKYTSFSHSRLLWNICDPCRSH